MDEIILGDGKYHFYVKDHILYCDRNGKVWREFIGDNAVHVLFQECLDREEKPRNKLERLLSQCTESQQSKFRRIYTSIKAVSETNLDSAVQLCERTLEMNLKVNLEV